MIEAPSGISGSAFCTVNSTPLTLTLKMESNSSSVMFPSTDVLAPRFRERLFHPDDLERSGEERRVALDRGVSFEAELRARRNDGGYRWFLIRYNPFRNEQGQLIRWYATGTDIDDRVRAEQRTR